VNIGTRSELECVQLRRIHWEGGGVPMERNTRFGRALGTNVMCDHRIKSAIPVSICPPNLTSIHSPILTLPNAVLSCDVPYTLPSMLTFVYSNPISHTGALSLLHLMATFGPCGQ